MKFLAEIGILDFPVPESRGSSAFLLPFSLLGVDRGVDDEEEEAAVLETDRSLRTPGIYNTLEIMTKSIKENTLPEMAELGPVGGRTNW